MDALGNSLTARFLAGPGHTLGQSMAVREARLLPEWAGLYPGLPVGRWIVASRLVPLVLRHRLQNQPTWEFARRILLDEHFEFRGGRLPDNRWAGILSRVDDAR
ncbi:MAG: hypothetical protein ABI703_03700 [Gemmatimonadales bacterium]